MKSLTAFLLAVGLVACGGIGVKPEAPHLSFVGLKALETNLFEQKLEVRLRVQNPNKVDLPVNGLDINLDLAGEPFAHGVSAREFTVPAHGEAEFDMNVTANAASALIRILGSDQKSRDDIDYRIKGKLSTHLGMLRSIPFDETGRLPISSITDKKSRKPD